MNNQVQLTVEETFQRDALCATYPILKKYITQCFNEGRTEELFEFLDGIKLSDIEVTS